MNPTIILGAIMLALLTVDLSAQQPSPPRAPVVIRGEVLDDETGEPLPGATIRIIATADGVTIVTKQGAIAGADGSFEITASAAGEITAAAGYIGYEEMRVRITDTLTTIVFRLIRNPMVQQVIEVSAPRRSRTVEDACCRVESIHEEVQQHAPFSPSVSDVLRRYSSCTSTRVSCAGDNAGSIRLRGLEPTYVRTLVDGLPAFSGLSTFYGLSMIPAHATQTIKISEGASSALYGNGAISGVVDVQTRPPTEIDEFSLSTNVSGGESGTLHGTDLHAGYTGMAGDVGLALFGSYNSHPGEKIETGLNHAYRRFSGLAKANLLLDDATEMTLTALGGDESRNGSEKAIGFEEETNISRIDVFASVARTLGEMSELSLSALYSTESVGRTAAIDTLDATQRILYARLLYTAPIGDAHLLTLGAEIRDDRLSEWSDLGIAYRVTIPSMFAQDEYTLGEAWSLLGSLRLDHHSQAGFIVTPRASIRFEPIANTTMRLMAGGGFKGEALFDEDHQTLHGVYRWRLNPDFGFERSFTLNYDISHSFLIGEENGIDANFNTYYTTISGKATPDLDSLADGALFYVNSDRPARLIGIEAQIRPNLGLHWSGSLALALIHYAVREPDGSYRQMTLAPRANFDASLLYRDDEIGFTAEAWGSYIGSQKLPANPGNLDESPAYALLNMRAEKTFGPIAIFVGAVNLLDTRQEETMPLIFETGSKRYNGSVVWGPMEGREFFLGARLTLGGGEDE